jgi:hypothetical protein
VVLLVVGVVMAVSGSQRTLDDVPDGVAERAIEAARSEGAVSLVVSGGSNDSLEVSVCPGLVPGPSDAAGMLERVRVSGCVAAVREAEADDGAWTFAFAGLDAEQTAIFDAAERWLVVVIDPDNALEDPAGIAGSWIAGGPLVPGGPLLP